MKKKMLKRKGVNPNVINYVATQITDAQMATPSDYSIKKITLNQIDLWSEQSRSIFLTQDDLIAGKALPGENYQKRSKELESIISLSHSIYVFGMLNPPIGYALPDERIKLIAGHRRLFALIYMLLHIEKIEDINNHPVEMKIYTRRLDEEQLVTLEIMDNAHRIDIPVRDKIHWLLNFIEYRKKNNRDISPSDLSQALGLAKSQSYKWIKIVQNIDDKWIGKTIDLLMDGKASLNQLLKIAAQDKSEREKLYKDWFEIRKKRISLGTTENTSALSKLVISNSKGEFRKKMENINWSDPARASKAFAKFLRYWEESN